MYHRQQPQKDFNQLRNKLDDDDDKRSILNFVLNDLGRPPPPPSFFRQLADKPVPPPTVESLQARLQSERQLHREELEQIYDFQVAQREQLYKEQRMAMDGGDYYPDPTVGDRPEDVDKIVPLPLPHQAWAASSVIRQQTYTFDYIIQRFNQGFIESQLPLQKQLKVLQKEEEDRRNMIALPQSLADFDSLPKSHQISVARTLDSGGKIAFPSAAQVNPNDVYTLLVSYNQDAEFQARVKEVLASIQSSDPRKRAQA